MKVARRRRLWAVLLGLLLLPPALWGLVLSLVPTEWARTRLVRQLAGATGQPVQLEGVRLGLLGGVRLKGLRVGAPAVEGGPWLQVADLSIDISLAQLLAGHIEPRDVEAAGVSLRLHRRADGTFEFGDWLRSGRSPAPAPAATRGPTPEGTSSGPAALAFRLREARLLVIDEPSATKLDLNAAEGQGTWQHDRLRLDRLAGVLNGGEFELAAQYDRGSGAFDGQVRARKVALEAGMSALAYLVPVLAGMRGDVDGHLDLEAALQGNSGELLRTLAGRGTIALDPIALGDSPLVEELAGALKLSEGDRAGSVRSDFAIQDGRVSSKDLTLKVAGVPIVLAGWTEFSGRLDYRVKAEGAGRLARKAQGLAGRLGPEARDLLGDLPADLDRMLALRVAGTLDHLVVTADGLPPVRHADPARRADDRARFRELGRRLRDRLLR
jgi:hypothetical protein